MALMNFGFKFIQEELKVIFTVLDPRETGELKLEQLFFLQRNQDKKQKNGLNRRQIKSSLTEHERVIIDEFLEKIAKFIKQCNSIYIY